MIPTLPGLWYTDPAILEVERRTVLRLGWRYVGDAGDVEQPNSYLATSVGGVPLVITRDSDRIRRGNVNVCRHRAAQIAHGCGTATSLMCPYHGWSYGMDGRLESAVGTDVPTEVGLPPADVDTIGPLLFAALDPQPTRAADQLRPFLDLVDSVTRLDLATMARRHSSELTIRANWKVVVENFVECYHCPLVHATTLPRYGRRDYAVTVHDGVQTQHLDSDRFSFAFAFPTTQISAYGNGRAVVAREIVPIDVQTTTTRLDYWFEPEVDDAEAKQWIDFFDSVIAEDEPLCESAQRGLNSGFYRHGYLHTQREAGLIDFHQRIRAALGELAA